MIRFRNQNHPYNFITIISPFSGLTGDLSTASSLVKEPNYFTAFY